MNEKEKLEKPEIVSQKLKVTFVQEADCTSSKGEQFLTISTCNGGGGDFYIMKTKRWAFDNIDEVIELLTQFKNKHKLIEDPNL